MQLLIISTIVLLLVLVGILMYARQLDKKVVPEKQEQEEVIETPWIDILSTEDGIDYSHRNFEEIESVQFSNLLERYNEHERQNLLQRQEEERKKQLEEHRKKINESIDDGNEEKPEVVEFDLKNAMIGSEIMNRRKKEKH